VSIIMCLSRSVGGEVTQDGDFLLFEGNRYDRRGFLYKNFVMSAIVRNTSIMVQSSPSWSLVH